MWVGQYKCLNPDDLLCNQSCPLDASAPAQCGEAAAEFIDPVGCSLMQYCMPVSNPAIPASTIIDIRCPWLADTTFIRPL